MRRAKLSTSFIELMATLSGSDFECEIGYDSDADRTWKPKTSQNVGESDLKFVQNVIFIYALQQKTTALLVFIKINKI